MKRRLVNELKDSFSRHPVYNKIVPFIQNKYSFKERPQFGIVVKGASANRAQLSSDNFLGMIDSHVMLCFYGAPAYPIEWVREDQAVLQANRDVMPLSGGIYFLEVLEAPTNASDPGQFMIDPLLDAVQEPLLFFESGVETQGQLQNMPVSGTVHLYENGRYGLKEGTDFAIDYPTGKVTFLTPFDPGSRITANYRYAVPSIGPVPFFWNTADFKTLPGVVMAFGKRAQQGDKVAIVITQDRVTTARAYGGKWELTYELDCMAQDPLQMEEISDWSIMYLWADRKPLLELEGIEILDVSMGGESEEPMDETGDNYMYTSAVSIQLRADWELHIPLPFTIRAVQPVIPGPPGTEGTPGLVGITSNLIFATLPLFAGRNSDFERIK